MNIKSNKNNNKEKKGVKQIIDYEENNKLNGIPNPNKIQSLKIQDGKIKRKFRKNTIS